jgi:hypothetical protein
MTDESPSNVHPFGLKKDGTPAKPRGFQKGGANYKPPSGIPASGIPASGNLQFGSKGRGSGPKVLIPGQGPEKRAITAQNRLDQERAAEEGRQKLYALMHGAEAEATQLAATIALLNRIEGAPVQRNINASLDDIQRMKDDELAAELEAVRRARITSRP